MLIRRLTIFDRLKTVKRNSSIKARPRGLARRGLVVSALAANEADDVVVVLVVEDDHFVRLDVADSLEEAGYAVIEAGSGEAAVALCNAGTAIDIIITDINLGGSLSGWDVAECFRTVLPNMPVLYTSGERIDRTRCVSGSAVLAKPCQNGDILKECQRLTQ
jgi:CheY-like chemotaxis protein